MTHFSRNGMADCSDFMAAANAKPDGDHCAGAGADMGVAAQLENLFWGSFGVFVYFKPRLLERNNAKPDIDLVVMCGLHGNWRACRHHGGTSAEIILPYGAVFRFDADLADLCLFDPCDCVFWVGGGAWFNCDRDFVLPAPIRLTQLGISSTPTALLEAATAFGATPKQRLWKVELPYAMPQIMVGLNQTIMLSLSMVVIAALVGANGLGVPVIRALNSVNTALGFESGFIIVVVAVLLDRMLRVK